MERVIEDMEDHNSSGMRTARATEDMARYLQQVGEKVPHLEKGLRANTRINKATLASMQRLEATSAELVEGQQRSNALLGQIHGLQQQANRLAAQQLYAQREQLELQKQQLVAQQHALANQLQQIELQRQQLALQVDRETREAQENQLLRDFVDMHEAVKRAQYASVPFLAYLLIVAADRMYAQLYRDSDSASNRMTLSTLRDKNLEILATLMSDAASRQKIGDAYVDLFIRFAPIVRRFREATTAFDGVHGAYRASVCISLSGEALAPIVASSPCRTPVSGDPMSDCEVTLSGYESAVATATQHLDDVVQDRATFEDDIRVADLALVPRKLGTGVDALMRFDAPVRGFRTALDEAISEPFEGFVDSFLSLGVEAGRRAAEGRRILELLQRVRHRQSFVRGMQVIDGWSRETLAALEAHRNTMDGSRLPAAHGEEDVAVYLGGKVRVWQGLGLATAAGDYLKAVPFLLDPTSAKALHHLFEICSTTPEVVPWLASVLQQCAKLQSVCGALAQTCRQVDAKLDAWRVGVLKVSESAEAIAGHASRVLDAADLPAVEAEVQRTSEKTSERLLSVVRTKRGDALRRQQLFGEVALRVAAQRAYSPIAIGVIPPVVWPA